MEMVEVVMNPVRQRIFQYLLIHEKGTVKEIKKELQDIPKCQSLSSREDPGGSFYYYSYGRKQDPGNCRKCLSD